MQTSARRSVLWVVGLIGLAATAWSQTAATLNGNWKGVYFIYPHLIAVDLKLQSSGESLSGELKFYPAVAQRPGFSLPATGKFAVSGLYDESSHSFSLNPGAWIEQPPMQTPKVPIVGVFDGRHRRLAGMLGNSTALIPVFFILVPEAEGERFIADIAQSAYPKAPVKLGPAMTNPAVQQQMRLALERQLEQMKKITPPPGTEAQFQQVEQQLRDRLAALSPPEAGGDAWRAPSAEKILAWASRLKDEAAMLNPPAGAMDRIMLSARNLFADEIFRETFGLTFVDMNGNQRGAVVDIIRQHSRELPGYDTLGRPFLGFGDFGAPDVTVFVSWHRAERAWFDSVRTLFGTMAPEANSFSNLAAIETAAGSQLPFLWPSDKRNFDATLVEVRARLAMPVLTIHADKLIATASGHSGARDLAAWQNREREILPHASAGDRDKLQQRIDARLDEILAQLVAVNLRALPALGRGLDAVTAGGKWYQQFKQSFDFALARPPIQSALRQFQQARAKHLADARPALLAQIDACKETAQVKQTLADALSCPGDAESDVAAALRQRGDQRIAAIKHDEQLHMFSEYEKSLMVPRESGHLDLSRADEKHLPEPEELRLALLRGFAFGTGEMIDPHTAKISSLFGAGSMIVRISDPKNARYAYDAQKRSWLVVYEIEMHFSLPAQDALWNVDPNFRRGAQMAVDMTNTTAALLSHEQNVQEFHLYPDGWGVPSLREQGAAQAGVETVLRGMMKH